MDVAQMLAHCCIPYLQLQGEVGGGPWPMRFLARHFFKQKVVGEALYGKNIPSPKAFSVEDEREFQRELERLQALIHRWHSQGAAAFEGREHVAFGPLTAREWSNLLYKHLDHHLRQFGA
jgi:cytosine/adenosine deaminase-related metal-dependent hydrolase